MVPVLAYCLIPPADGPNCGKAPIHCAQSVLQPLPAEVVIIIKEDRLAAVSTQNDVMQATLNMQPRFSLHCPLQISLI